MGSKNIVIDHVLKDSGPISESEALARDHSLCLILHKDYIPTGYQAQGTGMAETMDMSALIAYRGYPYSSLGSAYDAYAQNVAEKETVEPIPVSPRSYY